MRITDSQKMQLKPQTAEQINGPQIGKAWSKPSKPCVIVKKSEWDKMPKKTKSAFVEMCKVATEQFDPDAKRRNLAKAIVRIFFDGSMVKEIMGAEQGYITGRVEKILKKHGV